MTVCNFLFIFVVFLWIVVLKAKPTDCHGGNNGQTCSIGIRRKGSHGSIVGKDKEKKCGPESRCKCRESCGNDRPITHVFHNGDCSDGTSGIVCCCKSYSRAWKTTTLLSHLPTSSPSPISSLITKTSVTSSSSTTLISTSIREMSSTTSSLLQISSLITKAPTSSSMTRVPTLMAQTSTTATISSSPISIMTVTSTTASSPLPVQSLITEIERTSPSSTSPIPTFMRDSSTAAILPLSAVPSTKSPAPQSTIKESSSKTTQTLTWEILVSRYSSLIRALNVSNKGSLQEGINETRSFLEDAKKLPPGGNGRNVLVATHELESFAMKYGKTHLTANESAVIVQELLGFVVMKIQRVLENNTEPITCSKSNGTESIVIPSENFKAQDGVRIDGESQAQCEWMYRMFSHHCLPSPASWCFTLMNKELPALLKCLTTGNSDQVSKRLLGIFSYLTKWDPKTQTLPPPEPIELRAMICCGLTKEMLPLPTAVKIHPAFDFLKILLAEAEIVSEEALYERPVFKVYGRCDECQQLLRECPTPKDVGLSPTEVMYVMMPAEWSDPIDWEAEGCSDMSPGWETRGQV